MDEYLKQFVTNQQLTNNIIKYQGYLYSEKYHTLKQGLSSYPTIYNVGQITIGYHILTMQRINLAIFKSVLVSVDNIVKNQLIQIFTLPSNNIIYLVEYVDKNTSYQTFIYIQNNKELISDIKLLLQLLGESNNLNKFKIYSNLYSLYSKNDYMASLINKKICHLDSEYQEQLNNLNNPNDLDRMEVFSKVHTVIMEPVVDLYRQHLPIIFNSSSQYCLTDKADGCRSLLYIDYQGKVHFMGFGQLSTTDLYLPSFSNSLFDGEMVENLYLIFDVLFWKNQSRLDLPLLNYDQSNNCRFQPNELKQFSNKYRKESNRQKIKDSIKINYKTYYHGNNLQQQCQEIYQKNHGYKLDGLIFTNYQLTIPEMLQYRDIACFRWKPVEFLSIDVLVKLDKTNTITNIESPILNIKDQQIQASLYSRNDHNFKQLDLIAQISLPIGKSKYPEIILDNNNTQTQIIYDQSVVEFIYLNRQWKPIRTREAKTALSLYDRTSKVKYIQSTSPITLEELTNFLNQQDQHIITKTTIYNQVSYFFDNPYKSFIRRHYLIDLINFNNLIKFNIVRPYLFYHQTNYLDLGCGRGNDLFIWHNNVSNYYGIDLDNSNILTCKETLAPKYRLNDLKYQFIQSDLSDAKWSNIFKPNFFDVISFQFTLHYLTSDQMILKQVLNNCQNLLKMNGILIITGLDGESVHKLLIDKSHHIEYSDQDDILWGIEKRYNQSNLTNVGQQIHFTMQSLMGMKPSQEYLINFNYLTDQLNQLGLKLVNSELFSQQLQNDKYSKIVKYLYQYCHFKRYTSINYDQLQQHLINNQSLSKLNNLYRFAIYQKK